MPDPKASYHDVVRTDVAKLLKGDLGRLLDFGGGVGATSLALKQSGQAKEIVLVDLVSDESAGEFLAKVAGDMNDLSLVRSMVLSSGPFDTILCLDVLEHLYDPWSVVGELVKGMSPNGRMVVSIPNVNYIGLVGPLVLYGRWELQDDGILDRTHIRWFTRDTSKEMLLLAGLNEIDIRSNIPKRYNMLNKITFGLFERFFVQQYILIGMK